jgi:S-adenosylmethionine-dependent methyltransferase
LATQSTAALAAILHGLLVIGSDHDQFSQQLVVPDPLGIRSGTTCDSIGSHSGEWAMKKMNLSPGAERFHSSVDKYAAYLATAEGRLRLDLAFANLQDFLLQANRPLVALDLGCGPGDMGVRLAKLGAQVTLLDASPAMLDLAERAAREAGVTGRITLKHGDAALLAELCDAGSFDVILCHNVLEYVDDANAVLRAAVRGLRDPSSVVSIVVRNQAGEVLKAAIQNGDLTAAEDHLTVEWGDESLYGGKVRLFSPETLQAMLAASSLTVTAVRGVRVLSDYLPPSLSRNEGYARIFELERKLGTRPEFAAIARYTHCIAHRAAPVTKVGV